MRDKIQLFVQLDQLQGAGVPLLEALTSARDSANNRAMKDIMTEVYRAVTDGISLSEALSRHPEVFTNLFVTLVAAGEETGDLGGAFKQLIKYMSWMDEMQTKVKKATMQPKIAGCAIVIMMFIMLKVVVPQVIGFITNLDQELPFYTKALIATSRSIPNLLDGDFNSANWCVYAD